MKVLWVVFAACVLVSVAPNQEGQLQAQLRDTVDPVLRDSAKQIYELVADEIGNPETVSPGRSVGSRQSSASIRLASAIRSLLIVSAWCR